MNSAVLAVTHPSDVKPTIARAMAPMIAPNNPGLSHNICGTFGMIITSCLEKGQSLLFSMKGVQFA
jgi:hypothetical protein